MSILEVRTDTASAEDNVNDATTRILSGMLRTGYGYAQDKPEEVYLHAQISSDNSASFSVLFRFGDMLLEPHELNTSGVKDDEGKKIEFDVSQERQMKLYEFLATDLFEDLIPAYRYAGVAVPREIWTSYNVENDDYRIEFAYVISVGSDSSTIVQKEFSLEEWKNLVKTPDADIFHLSDHPYLVLEADEDDFGF